MKSQFPNNKDILVVGSKKGLKIPTSKIYKAYLANGAISLVNKLKKTKGFEVNCITGAAIYLRHKEIRKKILKSKPNRFVIRGQISKKDLKNDFNHKFRYRKFETTKKINNFQSKFFVKNSFSILIAEYFYENNIFKKIVHFTKILLRFKKNIGVSTGFFTLLLALDENKESNIIISGISMKEGKHFFKKKRSFINRARVDAYLFNKLKQNFKERIATTDKLQALELDIKYFREK